MAVASLRSIAASIGVPYVTAYRSLWRLLGIGPRHMRRMDNPDVGIIHGGAVETVIKAVLALSRRGLAYYTMPPVPLWPWLLTHIRAVDALERLLEAMAGLGARPTGVVLDIGVMNWFNRKTIEYTGEFWKTFWHGVDVVRRLARRYRFAWRIVLPDVPATVEDNISHTMKLQEEILSAYPDLPWLPVAQASRETPHTVHLAWLVETGIVEKYGVVALGSLKLLAGRRKRAWIHAVEEARRLLEDHGLDRLYLHLFGAPLDAAISSRLPPGSWDSKTWTFPRVPYLWSAKGSSERLLFFTAFLERLVELLASGRSCAVEEV